MDNTQAETLKKPSLLEKLGTQEDWDSLTDEDWAYLLWNENFNDQDVDSLFDELDDWRSQQEQEAQTATKIGSEPKVSLAHNDLADDIDEDEISGHTAEEWIDLIKSMSPSEFKKQYVDTMDVETIFKVFNCFDD